jgi:hypothetical protein
LRYIRDIGPRRSDAALPARLLTRWPGRAPDAAASLRRGLLRRDDVAGRMIPRLSRKATG